ncbi:MAG: glycosyltransferase family 87 protein [Ktedonobacterales bacterium]
MEPGRSSGVSRRSHWLTLGLWAVLVLVWAVWLAVVILSAHLISNHPYDFESYYAAAEALRFDPSATIYSPTVLVHASQAYGNCVGFTGLPYVYPPLLAIAIEPLTLLPCSSAAIVWLVFNAALWATTTLLLADMLAQRWPGHRLAAVTVMSMISLCFWQAFGGMFLGQIHLVLLFGMTLGLWLAERRRFGLAGGILAVVTVLKFFPAVIVIYYLARGRYRLVASALITSMGLVALMLLGSSPATVAQSVTTAFAFVHGLTVSGGQNESLTVTIPVIGSSLADLIGLTYLVVIARRRGDDLLGVGWATCAMLLASPLVWSFYLVWLLPAFCACLAAFATPAIHDWRRRGAWIALAVIYIVVAFPLSITLRSFATLALWAMAGLLYWRSGAAPPAPAPAAPIAAAASARAGG